MVLNQNQFKMSSIKGTKLFGHEDNVLEGQFYDASASATLTPGEYVCLDPATPAGKPPRWIKGADIEAAFFGVALTNVLVEQFAVGDFVQVGILSSGVLCEAGEAINVGQLLAYDPATKKVMVATTGDTVVGTALQKAGASGDLIKVFVRS
jgi:hypothetical protein